MEKCSECSKKPILEKGGSCTPSVVQINNEPSIVLFHRVDVPASLGDDEDNPPVQGAYKNILVVYEANGHSYFYNSDGIYTRISGDTGISVIGANVTANNHLILTMSDGQPIDAGEINIPLYTTLGDNTDKAINQKITTEALNMKVDKASGKSLSTNDYSNADKAIVNTNLNENFVTGLSVLSDTSSVTLRTAKKNPTSNLVTNPTIAMPVASSSTSGIMNTATFNAVEINTNAINAMQNGAVAISDISEEPTQQEISTAWRNETGLQTVINRASVYDIDNSKVWTYYSNTSTWYPASNTTQVDINQWTNTSAGIAKGSTADGQIYAENDGTGSVNGWDDIKSRISTLESNSAVITMTTTDPGEGQPLAENHFIAVYEG